MPKSKLTPYIFLAILIVILAFILGARYGQKVEQTNKVIDYLISLPPTKPIPTIIPLEFKSYKNKICGISFLVPSTLRIQDESSYSALLKEGKTISLEFNCRPGVDFDKEEKIATEEIKFQNKKIVAQKINNLIRFKIYNPKNGKSILTSLNRSLLPLFEKSLEFIIK